MSLWKTIGVVGFVAGVACAGDGAMNVEGTRHSHGFTWEVERIGSGREQFPKDRVWLGSCAEIEQDLRFDPLVDCGGASSTPTNSELVGMRSSDLHCLARKDDRELVRKVYLIRVKEDLEKSHSFFEMEASSYDSYASNYPSDRKSAFTLEVGGMFLAGAGFLFFFSQVPELGWIPLGVGGLFTWWGISTAVDHNQRVSEAYRISSDYSNKASEVKACIDSLSY